MALTSDGWDVYAVVYGLPDYSPGSATAVFGHHGDSWTAVWRANGSEPAGIDQIVVCRSGVLLATWWSPGGYRGTGRLLFSRDEGRNWYLADRLWGVSATAVPGHGWYGWYQARAQPIAVYSPDCEDWYGIPVG